MIYLYIEIYSYKQLAKISPVLIKNINHILNKFIQEREIHIESQINGTFLLSFADEQEAEPDNVMDSILSIYNIFRKKSRYLHGFNLYITVHTEKNPEIIRKQMQNALFTIKEEDGIWIHKKNKALFSRLDDVTEEGDYLNIKLSKKSIHTEKQLFEVQKIKNQDLKNFNKTICRIRTKSPKCHTILIHSRQNILVRSIINYVVKKRVGKNLYKFIPFINLKSFKPFHLYPFIGSMTQEFIAKLKQFLPPPLTSLLETKKEFLMKLYNEKQIKSDNLDQDIFYAYHLYLKAYCEMMKQKALPAIIICNAIEQGTEVFQKYFLKYISDFSQRYSLLIIFTSVKSNLPECFAKMKYKKIDIDPLSVNETRRCLNILYPGLKPPSGVIRQIQKLSDGNYKAILHYIYYLSHEGKIRKREDRYEWVSQAEIPVKIPVQPLKISWLFIKSLKEEEKIVFYILHLTHNILSAPLLINFLENLGIKEKSSQTHISYLKHTALIINNEENSLEDPGFSGLLKNHLGGQSNFIKRRLMEFLKQNLYPLLPYRAFPLIKLMRWTGDFSLLPDILQCMLQYALDTSSLSYARFLLKLPSRLSKDKIPYTNKQDVDLICHTFNVRYLLLTAQIKEAHKFVTQTMGSSTFSYTADPIHADLHLQLSRFYLTEKLPDRALDQAKKAALYFQELDLNEKMSESYLELGQALLAKGSVFEALDYFEFARKFSSDTGNTLIQVKAYLLKSITLFFIGNYTQSLNNITSGIDIAENSGLRKLQTLSLFIKVRIYFDLGLYEDALNLLEQCLALARCYSLNESFRVLWAWIARSYAYCAEYDLALTILKSLDENCEILYFQAEIFQFQNQFEKSVKLLTKAGHLKQKDNPFFSEQFSWKSGFSLLEDRRFDLSGNESTILRRIKCFKAYCSCFSGNLKQGLNELHTITIREKLPPYEPVTHLYYFLYYLILKKCSVPKDEASEFTDNLTVLNLALKHLQERSTTIDEPRQRIHYISKNYWNKLLFQEAKQNKLL
jgi:tetratricopeptide (TPR) repeat protein